MVKIIGDVNREAMAPLRPVKRVELPPQPPLDYEQLKSAIEQLDQRITRIEAILKR